MLGLALKQLGMTVSIAHEYAMLVSFEACMASHQAIDEDEI